MIEQSSVVEKSTRRNVVQIWLLTNLGGVAEDNPVYFARFITPGFLIKQSGILDDKLAHGLTVKRLQVLRRVVKVENFGLGVFINDGIITRSELLETRSNSQSEERIFLKNDVPLLDLPASKN